MAHWIAVFGAETARPPAGLEPLSPGRVRPTADGVHQHEARCMQLLTSNYDHNKPSSRQMITPGKGCGFSFEQGPYCSYATRDGVHVMMSGEVAEWPGGVDAVSAQHNAFLRNEPPAESDDAHWLLDFYRTFTDPDMEQEETMRGGDDIMSQALECLAHIRGAFAFVIYDSVRHRVLAARDREGVAPLFWGATGTGQLMFGSLLADLTECDPTATAFPAGCLFTSERAMLAFSPGERGWVIEGEDVPGDVMSFVSAEDAAHFRGVKAIPRITSKGMVCGAVYKVSSTADMSRPMMQH